MAAQIPQVDILDKPETTDILNTPLLFVEGPMGSGKTCLAIQRAIHWAQKEPNYPLLIVASNSSRQKAFTQVLMTQLQQPGAQWACYTFLGLVRNALFDCWPLVEDILQQSGLTAIAKLRPVLSGLEESEVMLKQLLHQHNNQHPNAFNDFDGTPNGALKQLIRRFRLRAENRLSRNDMTERSRHIGEVSLDDVAVLERQFDRLSYALRILDNNKQQEVFHTLLDTSVPFQRYWQDKIHHVIVEDLDEATPSQQAFIQWLAPQAQTLMLTTDLDGGSRRGYLNAYPEGWAKLKTLQIIENPVPKTIILTRDDPMAVNAKQLLENWRSPNAARPLTETVSLITPYPTRLEMIDGLVETIKNTLQQGKRPQDLVIVTPTTDRLAIHLIQSRLKRWGVNTQVLSGTERPVDSSLARAFLLVLQWKNLPIWERPLSLLDIKTVLVCLLQLDRLDQAAIIPLSLALFEAMVHGQPNDPLLPDNPIPEPLSHMGQKAYNRLHTWLNNTPVADFESQLYKAFNNFIAPLGAPLTNTDGYSADVQAIKRIIDCYHRQKALDTGLATLASMTSVPEATLPKLPFELRWLQQVQTGLIADTPDTPMAIQPESIIIGTPQKIIDFNIRRSLQLWVDTSSPEWHRTDTAPLYNAWVHSPRFQPEMIPADQPFEAYFNERLQPAFVRERAGHITRTLMLLAQQKIMAFSCELNDEGQPQLGLLKKVLVNDAPKIVSTQDIERATLRSDQAPVLSYRQGTMAITAVPGAGKTFVNVELILELISQGISPEKILVLTYMDSAAKTLLSRLRGKLSAVTAQLPTVSTIHSLAYRIVMENSEKLHLSTTEPTLLDDFAQDECLLPIAQETCPEQQRLGSWLNFVKKGIANAKTQGLTPVLLQAALTDNPTQFKVRAFLPAYEKYQRVLAEKGLLDFTDLIVQAVAVLETDDAVRQGYQQQFQVIIEDEAQDSSRLLQRLIHLLGGDTPNLIRTGDTNQSITTTFSSAETAVFRQFIQSADTVVTMTSSGRCCDAIMNLANQWIVKATTIPELSQAFEPVTMVLVPGFNPELLLPFEAQRFDVQDDECRWLVHKIQHLKQAYPHKSIAVLPFSNDQVQQITAALQQAGVAAISLSERTIIHPVFKILLAYLKLLANPMDVTLQQAVVHQLTVAQAIDPNPDLETLLAVQPLMLWPREALTHVVLKQLYYDIWEDSRAILSGNLSPLILAFVERWFHSVDDRSNGYLCAIQANQWLSQLPENTSITPVEWLINKMTDVERHGKLGKEFGNPLENLSAEFVQVMTLHKSKGQEFDLVFMPFMTQSQFRISEDDKLSQALKLLQHPMLDIKVDSAQRLQAQLEERARLVYVGITRARQGLFLSSHQQRINRYHRLEKTEPSLAFTVLAQLIAQQNYSETLSPLREAEAAAHA